MNTLRNLALFAAGAALAFAAPYAVTRAWAAVSQNLFVTVQTPKNGTVTFVQGTDTAGTYKTLYTGGANGSKIKAIWVTSNDASAAHLVTVQLSTSTSAHCSPQSNCVGGVAVTIPVNAGFANAVPGVNFMAPANWTGPPVDSDGNPFLYLSGSSQTLEVTFATTLTSSDQIGVTVIAEDF